MSRKLRQVLLIVSALVFLLLAMLLVQALRQPSEVIEPLPSPNGYDDLIQAAQSITGASPPKDASREDLRVAVEQNTNVLLLAREGLSKRSRVPLDYTAGSITNAARLGAMGDLKRLARLFWAEAHLATLQHRTNDALHAYLDVVNLGTKSPNGGLLIDALVGIAIREIGLAGIQDLQGGLTQPQSSMLAMRLKELMSELEPAAAIVKRERAWARRVFGWRWQLLRLVNPQSLRSAEQALDRKFDAHLQRMTLVIQQAEEQAGTSSGSEPLNSTN